MSENIRKKYPRICLVIGDPIIHSLSPRMHRAGYRELKLDKSFSFSSARVTVDEIPETLKAFKELGIYGAACTMPLKEALIPLVDHLDPHAQAIGAINTLILSDDATDRGCQVTGHNTDWLGVTTPLGKFGDLKGKNGLILGAGGAARAAIYALQSLGISITICNRTEEKAVQLSKDFSLSVSPLSVCPLSVCPWQSRATEKKWDIIINTTSLGMEPDIDQSPLPGYKFNDQQIVFETIYTPRETQLLKDARAAGAQIVEGIEMLLGQGAAQFELFTERVAPLAAMRKALEDPRFAALTRS